ncbi:hypothetical protein [Psychrobacillus sp. NPDC096623]
MPISGSYRAKLDELEILLLSHYTNQLRI